MLNKFLSLPIRILLVILLLLLALPSLFLIARSGINERDEAINEAKRDCLRLVYTMATEQQAVVAGVQQLATALAFLPEIRSRNRNATTALFSDLVKKNPQYINISVTDKSGFIWAAATPFVGNVSLADRRYFQEAIRTGNFSSGEYIIGKTTRKPTIAFGYPVKSTANELIAVIVVALDLNHSQNIFEKVNQPAGASFSLLDHQGIILIRNLSDPFSEKLLGRHDINQEIFTKVREGPDEGTFESMGNDGKPRLVAYRKLSLSHDSKPYLYVRSSIPLASITATANAAMLTNLTLLAMLFGAGLLLAWLIGKRVIVDPIMLLEQASAQLGAGVSGTANLSQVVKGGELGKLARAFDDMAEALVQREMAKDAAQAALRESEQRWVTTLASVGDAVIATDVEGRITFMNTVAEELTGWTLSKAAMKPVTAIFNIINEHTRKEIDNPVTKVLREGKIVSLANHKILLKKNRTEVPIDDSGAPIRDKDGTTRGVVLVFRDITERKKAEEQIQLQNRILEGINRIFATAITCETVEEMAGLCLDVAKTLTGSTIGFIGEIGADGRLYDITISNPGWDLCAMIDKTGHRRSLGSFTIHGLYGRVLMDGKSILVNDPTSHLDGIGIPEWHPPPKAFLGAPMIQGGKTVGMIGMGNRMAGYGEEQRRILESLAPAILQVFLRKRADAEIHTLTKRLSYHVKHSPLAVIEWGPDMRLIRWSGEAERIFGWRAEEVLGKRMEDFRWIYQEDESHVSTVSVELQSGTDTRRFSANRNYRKDGSVIHCEWYNSSMLDDQGNLLSILSLVLDVTERKQAEEALKEQSAKLEAANKELESFSYTVSHDLRAPLRAIDGYSRMILTKHADKFDTDALAKFNVIRDNTRMMGQLIDDLLAFSRLGRAELSAVTLDVEGLIRNVWEELLTLNPDRRLVLKITEIPQGKGDRVLIKQVLVNILSNAIKFTMGREEALIETGGYKKGNEIVYYVGDNGAGFDMQYYDKMFGVFQRLHSAEEFEGTGVGLAIVQRIIHRHGGRVWAEGEVGKGATVYFTLPTQPE